MTGRRASLPLLLLAAALAGPASGEAPRRSAEALIQTAFDRMLNYPSLRKVTFHIRRGPDRVVRRSFDVAYRKLDGKGHTLLRFTAPEYLRDSSLLLVEREDGKTDTWLYRPSDRRSRRVSTSQKGDAFFGSDFTFEDLEHHDWNRFEVERLPDGREQDRPALRVRAAPRERSAYSKLVAWIDAEDLALLRVDFYRGDADTPLKSLVVPREGLEREGKLFVPSRMVMRQTGREAETRAEFHRIEVDPAITAQAFSVLRLERSGQSLFDMVTSPPSQEERE